LALSGAQERRGRNLFPRKLSLGEHPTWETKGVAEDRVDYAYQKRRPNRGFKWNAKNVPEFPALGTNYLPRLYYLPSPKVL